MKIESISFKQFDRNLNKVVDYDKDRDEGVWLRYVASMDLSLLDFSFELIPDKTILTIYQDINPDILNEINQSSKELIDMFHHEIQGMWDQILHAYPATSEDRDKFLKYIEKDGEIIYNGVKLFYENLDADILADIKDKNQVKIQDEEICLNDILNDTKQ